MSEHRSVREGGIDSHVGLGVFDILRRSCVEMALNRIEGDEELYVGG